MRTNCPGLLGSLFGHRYEPRYDERSSSPAWVTALARRNSAVEVESFSYLPETERLYTGDVCRRCGDVVERTAPLPDGAETSLAGPRSLDSPALP